MYLIVLPLCQEWGFSGIPHNFKIQTPFRMAINLKVFIKDLVVSTATLSKMIACQFSNFDWLPYFIGQGL